MVLQLEYQEAYRAAYPIHMTEKIKKPIYTEQNCVQALCSVKLCVHVVGKIH